jgi:hypothetical protein
MADGSLSSAAFTPPPPFGVVDISSPRDTVGAALIPERCVNNAIRRGVTGEDGEEGADRLMQRRAARVIGPPLRE